jgi:hypothetical protein
VTDGVTVALQFLELSVQVRILVGQQHQGKEVVSKVTGRPLFFVVVGKIVCGKISNLGIQNKLDTFQKVGLIL